MITSVFIILLMLLLSAFFSGMEIAFTSKNRLKLEIDRKQSRLFNFIADIFARHPGQYITTILVGNNIALVIYSLYMSLLLRSLAAAVGWTEIARGGRGFYVGETRCGQCFRCEGGSFRTACQTGPADTGERPENSTDSRRK